MAQAIGTHHHVVEAGSREIADAFPDVVRHVETPAGAHGAGAAVPARPRGPRAAGSQSSPPVRAPTSSSGATSCSKRSSCASSASTSRSAPRSYSNSSMPISAPAAARRGPAWRRFLLETGADDDELGSHLTRARATATVKAFYRPEVAAETEPTRVARPPSRANCRARFGRWSRLERAAWLELATLLEPYLLSAQGDRVAMAHGVEGRFPVSRSPRLRSLGATARRPRSCDGMREKVALRELAGQGAAVGDRRARQAAVSCSRDRSVLRLRERPDGWRRRCRRRPWPRRGSGTSSASRSFCVAAAPAVPPGCASRWRSSASSRRQLWHREFVGRESAATRPRAAATRQDRSHYRSRRHGRLHDRREDIRTELRAYIEENFLYLTPGSS